MTRTDNETAEITQEPSLQIIQDKHKMNHLRVTAAFARTARAFLLSGNRQMLTVKLMLSSL